MEWVEVTGRTLEEAKDAALDQLGVDESEAEFEVLEEPRAGLFGRLRAEARVRARVQPTAVRPKVDRGSRRRGRKDRADETGPAAEAEGVEVVPTGAAAPQQSATASAAGGGDGGRAAARASNGGGERSTAAPRAS